MLFSFETTWLELVLLAFPTIIVIFIKAKLPYLFPPALFFALVYLFRITSPIKLGLWLALPIVIYLILLSIIPAWRISRDWLVWGRTSRTTWALTILAVAVSSVALVFWVRWTNPSLTSFTTFLPKNNLPIIIMAGLGFAILNSLVEEIIFRGILWDSLSKLVDLTWLVLIIQAAIFGAMHYQGFPSGISGVILAGIFGIFLGIIRWQSKGLAAPLITHFFADLTIFILVFGISL